MSEAAVASVPAPAVGSARYFALLYTPAERRGALASLLAISDEIGAARVRQLDHQVAHMRLDWWRSEAQRFSSAVPTHPWLIAWQRSGAAAIDLIALVDAATIDLATAQLSSTPEWRLPAERFVLAASVLGASLGDAQRKRLRELGAWVGQLEALPPDGLAAAALRCGESAQIDPPLQPALAPLLVWSALTVHQVKRHRQRTRRAARISRIMRTERLDALADNFIAWGSARRAQRGDFRISTDDESPR